MVILPKMMERELSAIAGGSLARFGDSVGLVVISVDASHCFVEFVRDGAYFNFWHLPGTTLMLDFGSEFMMEVDATAPTARDTPTEQSGTTMFWSEQKPLLVARIDASPGEWRFVDLTSGKFVAKQFDAMTTSKKWRLGIKDADHKFVSLIESKG